MFKFGHIFQKRPPETPPKKPSYAYNMIPKDYYFPVREGIDTVRQEVMTGIRAEEGMNRELASLHPDIQSIIYQASSIFPEAQGFYLVGFAADADLCDPPPPDKSRVHVASATGKGYQINLLFEHADRNPEAALCQVKLQIEISDRRLIDECLDPQVYTDIIGGFSYAKQVCDEWCARCDIASVLQGVDNI